MGMVVRTNTMALNAYRQLGMNNSAVAKSLEKLSSGFRINRAGDDAAGLAISEKMKAQITGLETASANAQDGISLIQTAEGNLGEVHDMLNRMVELATKSANGTYTATEREALQAEVDQLLDEIDRISQSANFNGAKLLDGTMGLNTGAFTKFSDVAATKAHDGILTGADFLAKEADGTPKVHLENGSTTAKAPSATIDLGKLSVHAAKGNAAEVTFTIGGVDYKAVLDAPAAAAVDGVDYDASDISAKLLIALKTVKADTGVADTDATPANDAVRIGDGVYTLTDNGGSITLTYAGYFSADGKTYNAETTFSGNEEDAKRINDSLGFEVTVKDVKKGTWTAGTDVIHMATKVDHVVAKASKSLAGVDIDLAQIVGQGNTLTIDGITFTFQTEDGNVPKDENGADIATATATGGLIDVSSAKTAEEAIHMAADKLSKLTSIAGKDKDGNANGRTWKIGVNGNGTTIHVDQSVATTDATKALNTYDKLAAVFGATVAPTEEANAATKVDVDVTKIVSGDSIRVDGKAYTFGDGEGQIALGENGADALANLKTALEADGYKAEIAKDGKSITIQAKDAKAESGPAVTGGGLTIQIGDTADEFNKMNISVANMSAKGLALEGLDITSETKASNAIDKIKTAINSVSTARAGMGALQNRLEHTINNLDVAVENLSAANSRIRDTDMAKEMMNYTKMNVLVQSAQAMLAQANQQPQSVLQLLQ